MFKALRTKLGNRLKYDRKGVFKVATAWFIFGAIILVFVFWGMAPNHLGISEGGAVAVVNDAMISRAQLYELTERMSRDPRFQQFQALGPEFGKQFIRRQAVSQLVQMELIRQQLSNERIMSSDAEVRNLIVKIPAFQEDGKFRREYYMRYLESVRKSPTEFEGEIRQDQAWRRTVEMFNSSLVPIGLEAKSQEKLRGLKANLEVVSVPMDQLVLPSKVKSEDVDLFLKGEKSAALVKDYYETHKTEFVTPEEVKVRHILVQSKPGDAGSEEKALEKIKQIADRIKNKKEDFAKVASEVSEDPGSKTSGGLLDFFSRGKMVPEFEKAAFSAPLNQVTEPVKTPYGYHLILVLDKKPEVTKSLEDAKNEIAKTLVAQEQSKKALADLQSVVDQGDTQSVNQFVSKNGLKWEETGDFDIEATSVPVVGSNEEILKSAFSLNETNPLLKKLVREGPKSYLVRYKKVKNPGLESKGTGDISAKVSMDADRRGESVLTQWLVSVEKKSKISYNPNYAN